mgnify:CR=1 FL=1
MLGGCAVFGGGAETSSVSARESASLSRAPARTASQPFQAAYGIGRPVALVPCSKGATLNDDCVGGNTRHQLGGAGGTEGEEASLAEISLIPVKE